MLLHHVCIGDGEDSQFPTLSGNLMHVSLMFAVVVKLHVYAQQFSRSALCLENLHNATQLRQAALATFAFFILSDHGWIIAMRNRNATVKL